MGALHEVAQRLKTEFAIYCLALKHPQTPILAKVLPGLVYLALKLIPDEVMAECRRKVAETP